MSSSLRLLCFPCTRRSTDQLDTRAPSMTSLPAQAPSNVNPKAKYQKKALELDLNENHKSRHEFPQVPSSVETPSDLLVASAKVFADHMPNKNNVNERVVTDKASRQTNGQSFDHKKKVVDADCNNSKSPLQSLLSSENCNARTEASLKAYDNFIPDPHNDVKTLPVTDSQQTNCQNLDHKKKVMELGSKDNSQSQQNAVPTGEISNGTAIPSPNTSMDCVSGQDKNVVVNEVIAFTERALNQIKEIRKEGSVLGSTDTQSHTIPMTACVEKFEEIHKVQSASYTNKNVEYQIHVNNEEKMEIDILPENENALIRVNKNGDDCSANNVASINLEKCNTDGTTEGNITKEMSAHATPSDNESGTININKIEKLGSLSNKGNLQNPSCVREITVAQDIRDNKHCSRGAYPGPVKDVDLIEVVLNGQDNLRDSSNCEKLVETKDNDVSVDISGVKERPVSLSGKKECENTALAEANNNIDVTTDSLTEAGKKNVLTMNTDTCNDMESVTVSDNVQDKVKTDIVVSSNQTSYVTDTLISKANGDAVSIKTIEKANIVMETSGTEVQNSALTSSDRDDIFTVYDQSQLTFSGQRAQLSALRRVYSSNNASEMISRHLENAAPSVAFRKSSSDTSLKDKVGETTTCTPSRVRFFLDPTDSEQEMTSDAEGHGSRSKLSVFKDMLRSSIKRKKKSPTSGVSDSLASEQSSTSLSVHPNFYVGSLENTDNDKENRASEHSSPRSPNPCIVLSPAEIAGNQQPHNHGSAGLGKAGGGTKLFTGFRRTQSTKCRPMKPLLEDELEDSIPTRFPHSVTEKAFFGSMSALVQFPSFSGKAKQTPAGFHQWNEKEDDEEEDEDKEEDFDSRQIGHRWLRNRWTYHGPRRRHNDQNRHTIHHPKHNHRYPHNTSGGNSIKGHIAGLLDHFHTGVGNHHKETHKGHSLASVELGSWARGSTRRGSNLPPFCTALSPAEASSRSEILQSISSSIIHLFQRKPLKDNELGLLQEHVRFLINSEAGGLVHEYYKDQLLRKGMIILREKIKNEQGRELLQMLGETWNYFFREILPCLQSILYPLSSAMNKDETVRSLSLLAFRNIVVLKVGIKEALDHVAKVDYPPSIQQMLLVLQSIQDNVFLSENQFLLEKLVARVVCPYLGQRGIYEGSPDPVIKVKVKPIPLNVPIGGLHEDKGFKARLLQSENNSSNISNLSISNNISHNNNNNSIMSPSPLSMRRSEYSDGVSAMTKLKPVLEHVYDGGRRHSIMS